MQASQGSSAVSFFYKNLINFSEIMKSLNNNGYHGCERPNFK